MFEQIIFAEKRAIKPAKIKQLEAAGYLVVVVPDISKVKLSEAPKEQPAEEIEFE